jgi:hypothetical protein
LFNVEAVEAIYNLRHFTSQNLSNMLWAYAHVGASNSALFNAAGDSVIALEDLSEFMPQKIPTSFGRMQLQWRHIHGFS